MTTFLRAKPPVRFDVNNATHRQAYITFLASNKWPMIFEVEWPFTSLPSMVMFKLAAKACETEGHIDLEAVLVKAGAANVESATLIQKAA